MKATAITIAIVLFATNFTFAQQNTNEQKAQQIRRGNRKITIGVAMIVVGALVAPLTAANSDKSEGATMTAGAGAMFIGSGVVWWGVTERRRAVQPQVIIDPVYGRKIGLQFRRAW